MRDNIERTVLFYLKSMIFQYLQTNLPILAFHFGKNVAPLLRVKLLRLCVQQGQSITML